MHSFLLLLLFRMTLWTSRLSIAAAQQQCRLNRPSTSVLTSTPSKVATPTGSGTNTPSQSATPFPYGQQPIRGVNLGGWFVLEPWITPSIFKAANNTAIVDEYTFGQYLDVNTAQSILQQHWSTWITETDFIAIKAAGLSHVRIPLGYWSVPLTSADTNTSTSISPYLAGAWPYLLQGLSWAQHYGIHVILDLHGAPGSQNGNDNSGQRTNNPQWALQAEDVQRTLDTIEFIVKNVSDQVDIIELLNEPAASLSPQWAQVIAQYWQEGYNVVRNVVGSDIKVMIGDGFLGVQNWTNFLTPPAAQGVMMDYHQYQVFTDAVLNLTWDGHIQFTCQMIPSFTSYEQSNLWTITGEWSTAITDCASTTGIRWDGSIYPGAEYHGSCTNLTGSYQTFSPAYMTFLRQYWEAQADLGESIQGWLYWTWKTESADEWSYQKGLEGGWIPQNATQRLYPGICSQSTS